MAMLVMSVVNLECSKSRERAVGEEKWCLNAFHCRGWLSWCSISRAMVISSSGVSFE